MSDYGVPEGTFRLEFIGEPRSTEDVQLMREVMSVVFWPEASAEDMISQHFVLPYAQGGGLVQVQLNPEGLDEGEGEDPDFRVRQGREEVGNGATFTGWWLTDYYQDSMTSQYDSPILRSAEGDLYTVAY